jgi:carotenoid cleavage dioxygenase-like enzyme
MAATQTVHPHLAGALAPVRTEDDFELEITGCIPDALAGAYYRNGPNPQFDPEGPYFGFLGDGMIHAFFLEPGPSGGRARYRNRWIRTPRWQAERAAGRRLFRFPGGPDDPSVAGVPAGTANTNVVFHAGKLLALHEQSEPFALDPDGLERGGFLHTGGKFTAHPKLDPQTGELVWFGYFAGPAPLNNLIDHGVTDRTGTVTRRDRFAAPYASVMHDFIVTRRHVVFPVLPLTADLGRAMKGLPPLAWEPARGAFLGVMRRDAGVDSIRWIEVEPRFFFHPMTAGEDGDPRPPVFPNADGSPGEHTEARLTRWTLDLAGGGPARREPLDDLDAEMPRFDERFAGLPYRHGWYIANIGGESPLVHNALAHLDLATGRRAVRALGPADAVGEPIFVPRSASAPEGDGFVLALVHHAATDASELLILDAQDIAGEPVVTLKLPRRVPVGFHGNFVPAGA